MVKMPEPMGGSEWVKGPSPAIRQAMKDKERETAEAKPARWHLWIVAGYFAGFILTFGYIAASNTCDLARAEAFGTSCSEQAALDASMTATVWPIYWPLSLSWSAFEAAGVGK